MPMCAAWSLRSSACARFRRCRARSNGWPREFRLVVLSNGDRDMLEAAGPTSIFPSRRCISVQDAGCFKPHRRTYETACRLLGVAPMQVMHVANHAFDCIGAKAAGLRAAFIDRRGRPFGQTPHQPDIVVTSMSELADCWRPDRRLTGYGTSVHKGLTLLGISGARRRRLPSARGVVHLHGCSTRAPANQGENFMTAKLCHGIKLGVFPAALRRDHRRSGAHRAQGRGASASIPTGRPSMR
jgi:hypothetical protein